MRLAFGRTSGAPVGRDRSVRVISENLTQTIVQTLGIGRVRILTHAGVKLPVRSEMNRAAVVVGGAAEVVEVEEHDLAARHGHVAVRVPDEGHAEVVQVCDSKPGEGATTPPSSFAHRMKKAG